MSSSVKWGGDHLSWSQGFNEVMDSFWSMWPGLFPGLYHLPLSTGLSSGAHSPPARLAVLSLRIVTAFMCVMTKSLCSVWDAAWLPGAWAEWRAGGENGESRTASF